MNILIQIIGFIGYLLLAFSYFEKKKNKILFIQIFAHMFFATHYYLLKGYTGALCNILCLIALIIIYKYNNKNTYYFIIPILFAISLLSFENVFSIFPITASILSLISFLNNDENKIRLIGIISTTCWLVYAIIYKSYVSILFESITILFVTIAYIKNHKH